MPTDLASQKCISPSCAATFDLAEVHASCPHCGNLLDVVYDWNRAELPASLAKWGKRVLPMDDLCRRSGVWRFRDLLPFVPASECVSIGEGHTQLRAAPQVAAYTGIAANGLRLQYEGLNPSGSFKDNGMAGAITHAKLVGAKTAACASTGNTSASLAAFAAASGIVRAIIFVGEGKIAHGKLSQALDYGALSLLVAGDFDDAMARVQEVCAEEGIYLVNSLNPFRLEGQKTIMYRVLEGLGWEVPDWIICPGGNLGNSSAFGKAFIELKELGLIDRLPRLAVINAAGAPTLSELYNQHNLRWNHGAVDDACIESYYEKLRANNSRAKTLASAIEINQPVNLKKCLRALDAMDGVVRTVSDQEILDAKALVGREGIGCEPASAASVAGLKKLVAEGVIDKTARVACILTGHQLKDPNLTVAYHSLPAAQLAEKYAGYQVATNAHWNPPTQVANSLGAIMDAIRAAADR